MAIPMTIAIGRKQAALAEEAAGTRAASLSRAGAESHRIRVLTITTLYPNAAQPSHGIFVENRIRHLVGTGIVDLQVIAPVPWFPLSNAVFGRYAHYSRAPRAEERYGIPIRHPRFLAIPKVGMMAAPLLLRAALLRDVRVLMRARGTFDVIDAHYFYPDGVAAAWLGRRLGIPVAITARGTDLNYLAPRYPFVRQMIRRAAEGADGLIAVCEALKDVLTDLGIPGSRVQVLRNGVDLQLFRPLDRTEVRQDLGLSGPTLLSVGHLIPRKGHDIVIGALEHLPGVDLLIAGEGPERRRLEMLARTLCVADRVRFLGHVPHEDLARFYSAADALILASSREGWANVLLEAMACSTPVVASDVWGTPEVVSAPAAGILVRERTPAAFSNAIRRLFADPPPRSATRSHAETFSWDATTQGQLDLFRAIIARRRDVYAFVPLP